MSEAMGGTQGSGQPTNMGAEASSSPQDNAGDAQEASTPVDSKKSTPAPKIYKVKVDGQELEVSETDLLKDYQLKQASNKRMQEASQLKKEYNEIMGLFEKNPKEALKKIEKSKNPKLREAVEDYLLEYIKMEQMDPRERALMEKDAKLREYEEKERAREEEQRQAEQARLDSETEQRMSNEVVAALEKSNLPATAFTVQKVAFKMLAALENDMDMTVDEAVQSVEEDELGGYKSALSKLEGERLLQILGDEVAEKIRKADLGRLKSTPTSAKQKTAQSASKPQAANGKKQKMTFDELMASLQFDD